MKLVHLSEVLSLEGIKVHAQQIAYLKLLAYAGCFDSPQFQSKGRVIKDSEANLLLNIEFSSLETGFHWLSTAKDTYLLRKEFHQEGTIQDKERSGINTSRWRNNNQCEQSVESQLYDCAKTLGLTNAIPWPNDIKVNHLLLICSLEKFIVERIKFISESAAQPISTLYVLTGPRGLFNFEEALATILAGPIWFNKPEEEYKIREVLNQHQEANDPLQWTMNLSALKKKLVTKMGVENWPQALSSYYYQDKSLYDLAAHEAGREALDCEGGAWPVTLDLVDYYFKKYTATLPYFSDTRLIPVVAKGKQNRLARIDDTLEEWYVKYGETLLRNDETPLIIACNTMHTIPFIIQNLMHTIYYQNAITQQNIRQKINLFNQNAGHENLEELYDMTSKIYIAGPASKTFDINLVLDSLAKMNFHMRARISHLIALFEAEDERESPEVVLMRKMIVYNKYNTVQLVNSSVTLASTYFLSHDFIKASGLFNFALNVLKKSNDTWDVRLRDELKKSTFINIKHYIELTDNFAKISDLEKMDLHHSLRLKSIRAHLFHCFSSHTHDEISILELYKKCSQLMKSYFTSLVNASVTLLGNNNRRLGFIYFGSNSRGQATPFSDVEFGLLTDLDETSYPKAVTKMLLLLVLNLGETVLSSLGITTYDRFGKKVTFNGFLYDSYTPDGYSFDQNIPQASKTPLGRKIKNQVDYRLIGTPSDLARLSTSNKSFAIDPYLPQVTRFSELACGDMQLYSEYQQSLQNHHFHSSAYARYLLERDLQKFLPELEVDDQRYTHKKHFFRPLCALIDNLYMFTNPQKNISTDLKIIQLLQHGIISEAQNEKLLKLTIFSMFLRFQLHFKYKEQKVDICSMDPEFKAFQQARSTLRGLFMNYKNVIIENDLDQLMKENQLAQTYCKRIS